MLKTALGTAGVLGAAAIAVAQSRAAWGSAGEATQVCTMRDGRREHAPMLPIIASLLEETETETVASYLASMRE